MTGPKIQKTAWLSLVLLLSALIFSASAKGAVPENQGSLAVEVNASPAVVNLTEEGTLDWANWGTCSPATLNRKAGAAHWINNFTLLGAGRTNWMGDGDVGFTWVDGTPRISARAAATGVFTTGIGNGFEVTVRANRQLQTLRLYVGVWKGQAKLEAALSEAASVAPFVHLSADSSNKQVQYAVYTVRYRAPNNNQTLRLRWTLAKSNDTKYGANVLLHAATLSPGDGTKKSSLRPTPQAAFVAVPALVKGQGAISGNLETGTQQVNLTSQGSLDWAQWGGCWVLDFSHKAKVMPRISDITLLREAKLFLDDNNASTYSWSDGTPEPRAPKVNKGVFVIGAGKGMELLVRADTKPQTLKLYVGLFKARGRLEAVLSDGTPTFVDDSFKNESSATNGVYTINFRAGASKQILRVRWTVAENYDTARANGNITLQAATLSSASEKH